jgi:hypothetical protein
MKSVAMGAVSLCGVALLVACGGQVSQTTSSGAIGTGGASAGNGGAPEAAGSSGAGGSAGFGGSGAMGGSAVADAGGIDAAAGDGAVLECADGGAPCGGVCCSGTCLSGANISLEGVVQDPNGKGGLQLGGWFGQFGGVGASVPAARRQTPQPFPA